MISILVTGGTGTFGRAFVRYLLGVIDISRIVVYSRDEQKQEEMERELSVHPRSHVIRYFLGDVRDVMRLESAMRGIDYVVHAAALKIVPKCEYDPIEAIRTNITGAEHVVTAAIARHVRKVIALSTDKAVSPVNLYGATKLVAERLFISANHISGSPGNSEATKFSVVRYGNVAGSRGSVVPLFKKLAAAGQTLPITHPGMTRFWISIEEAVNFVVWCLKNMQGGEVFIPRMPSFRVVDLAEALSPDTKIIGTRPGEKIHETLITPNDTPHLRPESHGEEVFIIEPEWRSQRLAISDFTYSSDTNPIFLTVNGLKQLVTK